MNKLNKINEFLKTIDRIKWPDVENQLDNTLIRLPQELEDAGIFIADIKDVSDKAIYNLGQLKDQDTQLLSNSLTKEKAFEATKHRIISTLNLYKVQNF